MCWNNLCIANEQQQCIPACTSVHPDRSFSIPGAPGIYNFSSAVQTIILVRKQPLLLFVFFCDAIINTRSR